MLQNCLQRVKMGGIEDLERALARPLEAIFARIRGTGNWSLKECNTLLLGTNCSLVVSEG